MTISVNSNLGALLRCYEALYNWRALTMLAGSFVLGGLAISGGVAVSAHMQSDAPAVLLGMLGALIRCATDPGVQAREGKRGRRRRPKITGRLNSAMQRLQAFKFELMPTGEQQRQMRRFAGSCRFVFNKALALQKDRYERGEKKLSYAGLCK